MYFNALEKVPNAHMYACVLRSLTLEKSILTLEKKFRPSSSVQWKNPVRLKIGEIELNANSNILGIGLSKTAIGIVLACIASEIMQWQNIVQPRMHNLYHGKT
jgi:hypothetical protein